MLNYIWKSPAEPKIQCFKWLLLIDRLPIKRNYHTDLCNICTLSDTGRHILFDCLFAKEIWNFFGIYYPFNVTIIEIVTGHIKGLSKDANFFWNMLSSNILWQIWKCRNEEKYQGKPRGLTEFFHKLSHFKIFLQVQATMIIEKDKFRRFLEDGQATLFFYELNYGFQWRRTLDNLRVFEHTCQKLSQAIRKNHNTKQEQILMLSQNQDQKTIVWMEGPLGWSAWVDIHLDLLL
ncbi:hypothetical protein SUGI_0102040 [Cryptomeria japonica]|nr:hypothetical protein SUGI_0102040 [Cryptomeria japonica]